MTSEKSASISRLTGNPTAAGIGRQVRHYATIDSTNAAARRLAEHGAQEGTVVVADYQTCGRGRLSRTWTAPPRTSLLCSIIFYPALEVEFFFRLTMLASIAVVDALRAATGIASGIKWPNDIYVGNKKICGILTEIGCRDDGAPFAVVGIGLNVNWSTAGTELELQATSVMDICGKSMPLRDIFAAVLAEIDRRYVEQEFEGLRDQWVERCMHIGWPVQVLGGDTAAEGVARGITPLGHLLLETAEGVKEILCGDVSLRLQVGG